MSSLRSIAQVIESIKIWMTMPDAAGFEACWTTEILVFAKGEILCLLAVYAMVARASSNVMRSVLPAFILQHRTEF